MASLDPKSLSTSKLHGYLLSAVAPRPIAFASTLDAMETLICRLSVFLMYLVQTHQS